MELVFPSASAGKTLRWRCGACGGRRPSP